MVLTVELVGFKYKSVATTFVLSWIMHGCAEFTAAVGYNSIASQRDMVGVVRHSIFIALKKMSLQVLFIKQTHLPS